MPGLVSLINNVLSAAFNELEPGAATGLRPSQHADFQVDGALALSRRLRRSAREVAAEILARANARGLTEICEQAEIAGPGFINLTVSPPFLSRALANMASDREKLGVPPAPRRRVVVDYGGPNAAKQMHVGHLRSTIIGDALVRLLELVGHEVLRENHIGDWGAPFGMLVEHLRDMGEDGAAHELAVGDLEAFYQRARAAYEADPGFADRARARVVLMQNGDPETLQLWSSLVDRSVAHFDSAFRRLEVKLTREDVVGESFYRALLPAVVDDLARKGLLVESDGALCVFPPGHTNRQGEPLPLIVQNSVGGYTYATTDLAAIKDRVERLGADLVLYVVGLPQAQHFQMVFATASLAGWLTENVQAVHVGFGNVLGPDGKMFRTRQGGTVKLIELIDEAVERARAVILARTSTGAEESGVDIASVAGAVGLGAVKYADLSTDRSRDYRFDWDRMLSFDGNTGPYIQYAHARVCSVFRRARAAGLWAAPARLVQAGGDAQGGGAADQAPAPIELAAHLRPPEAPSEARLAKRLLGFADAVDGVLETYSPHKLCSYLFDLAQDFTDFYERCPILRAPDEPSRDHRLALSALTAAVLKQGLGVLGIDAPTRM